MNKELELKHKRIKNVIQILILLVVGFFAAPFIYISIQGLLGLLAASVVGLIAINLAPWFSAMVANWRLKALKHEAATNPIETLENQYAEREQALVNIRDNIKEFHAAVQAIYDQIQEHNRNYPNKPSQFQEKYEKMRALLNLRADKYKLAQVNLKKFAQMIDEKRSDWKIAQAAAKATKLANVGEDFQSKLMEDSALGSIQDSLNVAFSELEVSLLDEQNTNPVSATALPAQQPIRALPEKSGPPLLDLDFEAVETVKA